MGGWISRLAVPSDATGCTSYIGVGGVHGAPLSSHRALHCSTSTVESGNAQDFEFLFHRPLMRFGALHQLHSVILTLRCWSYCASIRLLPSNDTGSFTSSSKPIYLASLIAQAVLVVCLLGFVGYQNRAPASCALPFANAFNGCRRLVAAVLCLRRLHHPEEGPAATAPPPPTQREGPTPPSSSSSSTSSLDSGDVEEDAPGKPTPELQWSRPLTKGVVSQLTFDEVSKREVPRDTLSAPARQRRPPQFSSLYNADGYPVDAFGVPLRQETQVQAAEYALIGKLPPDPLLLLQNDVNDDDATRTLTLMLWAFWVPNTAMCVVDINILLSANGNAAVMNGFYWLSFIVGFIASILPVWYYWQKWGVRWLEQRSRRRGTSPYSARYQYPRQ